MANHLARYDDDHSEILARVSGILHSGVNIPVSPDLASRSKHLYSSCIFKNRLKEIINNKNEVANITNNYTHLRY